MSGQVRQPARRYVAIVGAGNWGTALALLCARNHRVRLWARQPEVARIIEQERRNPYYLSDFHLPENISATSSLEEAVAGAEVIFLVVPSHAMRPTIERMRELISPSVLVVSATKGIESNTLMRMSEVILDLMRGRFEPRLVVLSGPSFAREVAKGYPTAVVAASPDREAAEVIQRDFSSNLFRIYTNDDVIGVELGGAVKNIIAIAAGVVHGLGFGTNSVAAIITRGLAEMKRLALAQGARAETMAGLAGLGDLVLTCTGELSRNRRVGIELGRGSKLTQILAHMREVAEGINTTRAVYELSRRLSIDMPITASIHALLYEDRSALDAANELMERPLKQE
jgi:glycerol-3-phosphate dehydrogenase (NAD(P)+)